MAEPPAIDEAGRELSQTPGIPNPPFIRAKLVTIPIVLLSTTLTEGYETLFGWIALTWPALLLVLVVAFYFWVRTAMAVWPSRQDALSRFVLRVSLVQIICGLAAPLLIFTPLPALGLVMLFISSPIYIATCAFAAHRWFKARYAIDGPLREMDEDSMDPAVIASQMRRHRTLTRQDDRSDR